MGLLTKMAKKKLTNLLTTQMLFLADFWGYRWAYGGIFGSNIPLALLVDSLPWLIIPDKKKILHQKMTLIWAAIGQNWPKSALRVMQNLLNLQNLVLEG